MYILLLTAQRRALTRNGDVHCIVSDNEIFRVSIPYTSILQNIIMTLSDLLYQLTL